MSMPRLELFTASDNLAFGYVQGGFVYNFWQDDEHNLGLWRRTSPASYKSAAPQWETVIDFDALAAAEGTNWVYSNADCLGARLPALPDLDVAGRRRCARDPRIRPRLEELRQGRLLLADLEIGS